ncbi:MAG: hypothetical protein KDE53_31265 [Caldilineaceae bacterium]|nr:hypothetical protein [Caldilineaceae bacterium]MCB0123595.1 hypothetical protein [Caldilineaceae bacterium]
MRKINHMRKFKQGWSLVALLFSLGIVLAACTPLARPATSDPVPPAGELAPTTAPDEEITMTATPQEEATTNPADPTAADPNAGAPAEESPLVQQAIADLAAQLGINADEIAVVEARNVTWRDGSLGCPQPDMMYTQVLIDGMEIVLAANGEEYHYHAGGDREPFLCEEPDPDGTAG